MLLTTLAVINGQVVDAEELLRESLPTRVLPQSGPRGLLVTVVSRDKYASFVLHHPVPSTRKSVVQFAH